MTRFVLGELKGGYGPPQSAKTRLMWFVTKTFVVMAGDGGLVEVQATAERTPLSRASLDELLALAAGGIEQIRAAQAAVAGELPDPQPA